MPIQGNKTKINKNPQTRKPQQQQQQQVFRNQLLQKKKKICCKSIDFHHPDSQHLPSL